ncbi:hypothetical protein [Aquisphaera insulae]|uniref:hypothetical protein n=1 Tax=Aquisphaera insulae TaxID=2712864 RepID=UPI0013EC331F|nr:hypothetical protein [Aquisphaera insulae]
MRPIARTLAPALSAGLVASVALAASGCGDSSTGKAVQVTPEFQKKTEDYLNSYQQKMKDQHQTKGKSKGH